VRKLSTEYLELKDARIAYTQHGDGPTLLLLHGNSESKRAFARYQTEHFRTFCTVAIDSRGHGETQSQDVVYSIEQYCDDVIAFCKAKGITRAFVIGYSDGGNIALFLAKKAPEIFLKIIAISPNYLVSGTTDGALRLFRTLIGIMTFLRRIGFRTEKGIARFNLMMNDIGLTDEDLRSIRTNMTILYAEKDLIKEDHIKQMAELIPNAQLHKVRNCNHITIFWKKESIEVMRDILLKNEN
jgi:phosphatidylglycerol lysyltransferase